jgi:hypothetical protein
MNDQFEAFAESCAVQCTAEPLGLAPRDPTATLEQAELHYLVTLTRPGSGAPVRFIFVKPATDAEPPTASEVLWWMAGDAHMMEGAQADVGLWATGFGLPARADGTARLFDQQRQQCAALRKLLGDVGYHRLIAIYESEMVGSP